MRYSSLLLLYFISLGSFAQLHFENSTAYTRKEGLSNNSVTCFVKDSRGFLWIGTSEGLNRFDGNRFVSFFNDRNDKETLNGNVIFDMLQYQPGHLLIATDNGLSVFNTFSNCFENEKITLPALRRGSSVYIRSLFKDKQNRIYINYSGEIDVFSNDLKFLYRLTDTPWGQSLRGIVIDDQPWFQDSKGRIWLPSDNFGICLIDEKKQQVYSWKNNPSFPFMAKQPIRSFFYDEEKQKIWFSAWGQGLEKYDLKTGQLQIQYFGIPFTGEGRTINSIVKRDNRFICCGAQGIYSLDPETMSYENIYKQSNGFSSSFINCHTTLNDAENIWIGTETKGLLQIPYHAALIWEIPLPYFIHDYTNFCTGIISSDSMLYFAYGPDGLVEVDERNFKTQHYPAPFINDKTQDVFRVCVDKKKNILVGTTSGFFLFDRKTKQYKRPDWLPAFTNTLNVQCIFPDSTGNIWFSFSNPISLGYYDAAANQFRYYKNYVVNNKKVFDDQYRLTRIVEDEKKNIWMISYQKGGIVRYNPSLNDWKLYPESSKAIKLLGNKELNSICITGNTIWVGNTYGLGLVQYDYKKDSIRQILRKDGLLSENILAISKDRENNLFLSTKAGLNYYITKTNEIRSIIVNNGDIDWGFAYTQYYDTVHNQLIFGLNDRILIIKNNLWEAQSVRLNTYINSIRVNNLFYPSNSSLSLDHLQKNISIDFTSINYNKNTSLIYAYKMEGIDKDWNIAPQATAANYSNLPPGQYTFLIKAKYQSGDWGPVNNSLHITIVAALWQRVWFWLLAGLLIALGVFFLMKKRINSIRKNAQLKQKLTETEMMALRSQMNPHFIFNCLNAIDNLIQTNQPDKATTYLARFAKLIRSLLESSKNNLVPFYKDFETLQLYLELEQLRANNKFSYKLNADEELLHGDYKVPPLIIQPFVENAIHHGLMNKQQGERKLMVTASLKNNFIQYTICDNGVGRTKAMELKKLNKPEHQSYGIQITTERIQLHNNSGKEKDIFISDLLKEGLPDGTEVKLRLKTDYQ